MIKRAWILAFVTVLALGVCLSSYGQSAPVHLGSLSGAFATLSATGELAYPGELDWFSFDVTTDETVVYFSIRAVDDSADLRMLLFEQDETYIMKIDSREAAVPLDAGTYRVRVDSGSTSVVNYVLAIYAGVEVESNDGLIEAVDLGTLNGAILLSASLAPAGDADYYRFDIPATGLPPEAAALNLETFGPSDGDTEMVLYRYDDQEGRYLPVASDDDSGDGYWSRILAQPAANEQYILRIEETVYPLEGIPAYRVALEPVTLAIDAEPNDTAATALALDPVSSETGRWAADGLLETIADADFYVITIPEECLAELRIGPQGALGDYDSYLTLYRPNGDRVAESDDTGSDYWSRISITLDPGDYVITVEAGAYQFGMMPYRLDVVTRSVEVIGEVEPNNDETESQTLDVSSGAVLVNAVIGLEADVDSYRIVLERNTTLVCETGPQSGMSDMHDTTLAIYDEDLWEVAYNDDSDGTWSRVEAALAAGTYFIVVESYYGDETFEYTLLVTASAD